MSSRHRKLDAVVARVQLQYGPRALRRAPAPEMRETPTRLSTTFPALDAALSNDGQAPGGVPRGRLTELSGPATSGKTTLAAKVLVAAHVDRSALVAWMDLTRTCDPDYLQRCGLELDRLLVVRPEDGLDALAITLHLVESNALAALVFDNLSELPAGHDAHIAGSLAHLATATTRTSTAVLFLTEAAMERQPIAHLAALRLRLTRERWLMEAGDVRGYEAQVAILKQSRGRSGVQVPIRIVFNGTVRGDGL